MNINDIMPIARLWEILSIMAGSAGAIGIGFVGGRKKAQTEADEKASTAGAEEEAARQKVIENFQTLINIFKERIELLTAELANANLSKDKAEQLVKDQRIFFLGILSRFLLLTPNVLTAEDIATLRTLGIEILQAHREADQHILAAKEIANSMDHAADAAMPEGGGE